MLFPDGIYITSTIVKASVSAVLSIMTYFWPPKMNTDPVGQTTSL